VFKGEVACHLLLRIWSGWNWKTKRTPSLAYHPSGLSEEEVMKLAMVESDLEEMGRWEGFSIQLRESALA
jgi:hypothetical protein